MSLLSEKTVVYLEQYLVLYSPKKWLFEGDKEDKPYFIRPAAYKKYSERPVRWLKLLNQ